MICTACHKDKSSQEMSVSRKTQQCKQCRNVYMTKWRHQNPDKVLATRRRYRANHPGYRLVQYGLTHDSYLQILTKQNNVCAICKTSTDKQRLAVDHNHFTGHVRGLLCTGCNTSLGAMNDNPLLLEAAATYLRERGA